MPAETAADLAGRAEALEPAPDSCPFGLGLGNPVALDPVASCTAWRLPMP